MNARRRAGRIVPALLLLAVTAYVTWDLAETRALTREIDAIAARGEPVTLRDRVFGADTPERHDAARIYAAALERVRAMPQEVTFRLPRLDVDAAVGPPLDLEAMEKIYRPDAPALQLLDQATPLDFNGFGALAPDVAEGSMTTMVYLAAARADLLAVRGKGDEAAAAIVPCVRFWRVASPFSRPIVTGRIAGSIRILLRHTSPGAAALESVQRALEGLPPADDMAEQVMLRRARFIDEMHTPPRTLTDRIARRAARPWFTRQTRRALASFEPTLSAARDEWPRKFIRLRDLERANEEKYGNAFRRGGPGRYFERLSPGEWVGAMSIPASGISTGREIALRRVMISTLAVERFRRDRAGSLPASLTDLVPRYLAAVPTDPFSGGPLLYRAAAGRYAVYSVDDNLRDDGGKLYGFGSKGQLTPRQREPHDAGIAVELRK